MLSQKTCLNALLDKTLSGESCKRVKNFKNFEQSCLLAVNKLKANCPCNRKGGKNRVLKKQKPHEYCLATSNMGI